MSTHDNTMDIDNLSMTMSNAEINPDGPNAQINSLAEQLSRSSLQEPELSVAEAHQILARAEVIGWVLDGGPKTAEQLLVDKAYEVIITSMGGTPPPPSQEIGRAPDEQESQDANWLAYKEQADAVYSKYGYYLDFEGENLANAELPADGGELETLGYFISDGLWDRHQTGDERTLVFSPWDHPCYPC